MPIYDFTCPTCGVEEERISTFSARESQDCKCGARMQVKPSAPAIVSGVKELQRVVPDGFKTVLKAIQKGAPRGKDDKPMETKGL